MRLLLALSFAFAVAGCTGPVTLGDFSRTSHFDEPPTGVQQTRAVGDVMIRKGALTLMPAINVTKPTVFNKGAGESSVMTCAITAQPGTYPRRGTFTNRSRRGAECFGPVSVQLTLADGTPNWNCTGNFTMTDICLDGEGKYFLAFPGANVELKQQFDQIRRVEQAVEHDPNLVQEVLYGGRSGDRIMLTYREFTQHADRPSFVQELQYDISASSTVVFRALQLEVQEATDSSISYKVTASF